MAFVFDDRRQAAEALAVVVAGVQPPASPRPRDLPVPELGDDAAGLETTTSLGSGIQIFWRSGNVVATVATFHPSDPEAMPGMGPRTALDLARRIQSRASR